MKFETDAIEESSQRKRERKHWCRSSRFASELAMIH